MGEFKSPWWKFWAAASDPGVVPFLYACFCGPCANADIATASGIGSDNWVFNCCCVPLPVTKMLYRKSKGHDGTCMGDCCAGVCCFGMMQMVNDLGDGFKMGAIDMDKIKADAAAGADAAKKND
eukprot:UN02559